MLVFVSDLHCGSTMGLCPPEYPTVDGGMYRHNALQAWMWGQWAEAWKWVEREFPEYGVVLNGDLMDGKHHHSIQLFSADWKDHVSLAVNCLLPHTEKARRVWCVRGTEVHVHRWETVIGQMLGAENVDGERAPAQIALNVKGCLCHFTHHMPVTSRKYLEAGALSIVLGNEQLQCARAGRAVPRVVVRGHRHTFGYYSDGRGLAVALPAWQFPTDYVHAKHPGVVPQVGLVALDWRGKAVGELPEVRTFLRSPQ